MWKLSTSVIALVLVVAACSGAETIEELPVNDDPAVSGACIEGTVDCNDTPGDDEPLFLDDEPREGAEPGNSGMVVGDGITVADLLSGDVTGVVAVGAFVYVDEEGARLCDLLAESLPPLCGGDTIPLAGLDGIDPDSLKEAQGVTWSDHVVTVFGEVVDGVFVSNQTVSG